MSFYEEVGARPFINAGGWRFTRYGGSIMPQAVVDAMAEASRQFVNLFDLQDQVGKKIAEMTHNQAAMVSCGAASGMLLCSAAVMTGTDAKLADRLPDTSGLSNQFIMPAGNRGTEIDAMIRGAGGKIVLVESMDGPAKPEEIFAAVNSQTAAIVLVEFESDGLPIAAAIIAGARERKIPVIIDCACTVPPKEKLWRYTRDLGADAVIISGGKAIHGPQTTGLVLGKSWIIEACKFHASPNLRIGRGMKVGKEQFAGIYTALKLFLDIDDSAVLARQQKMLTSIFDALADIRFLQIKSTRDLALHIMVDPSVVPMTSEQIAAALHLGEPSILLSGRDGKITIRANLLQDGEEKIVAKKLREVFGANTAVR